MLLLVRLAETATYLYLAHLSILIHAFEDSFCRTENLTLRPHEQGLSH